MADIQLLKLTLQAESFVTDVCLPFLCGTYDMPHFASHCICPNWAQIAGFVWSKTKKKEHHKMNERSVTTNWNFQCDSALYKGERAHGKIWEFWS